MDPVNITLPAAGEARGPWAAVEAETSSDRSVLNQGDCVKNHQDECDDRQSRLILTPQLHKNSYVSTAFFDRLRGFS
jgi:hypothetical protein